ncbi:MAG: response regulator transcription factor [Bacteroidales bacterium]|jgi:two-component system alkaline phosphatase synthesis response regulator PhoP|nr:response regulator transcription factor [Bacteroidales bacterium]
MITKKNKNIRILLIDKEPETLESMSRILMKENYNVYTASDDKIAIQQALKLIPHLILLDVNIPNAGGIAVCKNLRANPAFKDVIIAFLFSQNDDQTQIEGLNAGGDDYIAKSIQTNVLLPKVKSLLRRSRLLTNVGMDEIRRKNMVINKTNYTVQFGNKLIILPPKEFELLYMLAETPNKVFRREEIFAAMWGEKVIVGKRTIDVHVRKLREHTGIENIKTVACVGYKYEE